VHICRSFYELRPLSVEGLRPWIALQNHADTSTQTLQTFHSLVCLPREAKKTGHSTLSHNFRQILTDFPFFHQQTQQ